MLNIAGRRIAFAGTLTNQSVKGSSLKDFGHIFPAFEVLILVIAVLIFFLWTRLEVVNRGYDISRENKRTIKLVEENKSLRFQVVSLMSPERVERFAKRKIGLIYPQQKHIVVIK